MNLRVKTLIIACAALLAARRVAEFFGSNTFADDFTCVAAKIGGAS